MSQQAFGAFDDASVRDAALLSAAAWSDNLRDTNLATYLNTTGWKLASVPDFTADSAGYYSTSSVHAFAATKGDTLALSIRGIEDQHDLLGASQAVLDGGAAPYRDVLPFINAAINSVQNNQGDKEDLDNWCKPRRANSRTIRSSSYQFEVAFPGPLISDRRRHN